MRASLAVTYLCALALVSTGDEPAADERLVWQSAFAPLSAKDANHSLAVILITNDDAAETIKPAKDDDVQEVADLWCKLNFEWSFRKAIRTRADLAEHCHLQFLPAGTAKTLTGGSSRNQPARAIVAVCDVNYRLLSLSVGVPEADEVLTIIEDAQQVQSMINLHEPDQAKLAIADRSMTRLARIWRDALKEMLATIDVGNDDEANETAESSDPSNSLLGRIGVTFEEVYLVDVRLRFGMTKSSDHTRLVLLEQHQETRRPWCESMIPFVAGTDFAETWIPLTEAVWHADVVVSDVDSEELLSWWDLQIKSDPVVLAIQPPLLARQRSWPPVEVGGVADKRGLGWQDLQKLLLELPYQNIDAKQLAALIRERDLAPVDIVSPTRARYLLYEPNKRAAWAIREGDIPGKHIGRVKRMMKK